MKNMLKGSRHTEEAKRKMSKTRKGKKFSIEHRRKIGLAQIGRKVSEETRRKIAIGHLGKPSPCGMKGKHHSKETKIKFRKMMTGNTYGLGKHWKLSEETRKKMSESFRKGADHYRWKGGITPINIKIRRSLEYKLWRESVFKRDNFTCVWCGERGGKLQADHIKPFADYPELRFALDNGRTLCLECHKKTDNFGWKKLWYRPSYAVTGSGNS